MVFIKKQIIFATVLLKNECLIEYNIVRTFTYKRTKTYMVELIYFIRYRMVLSTNHSKISRMLRTLFLALLLSCNIANTYAQQVTVSNNLLYDAWLTPNLRVGFRIAPHWSVGLTGGYRPWPTSDEATRKWRHLLISPSIRYWKDSVNVHRFWGANLIYSHYNVGGVTFPFGLYKSVRNERREGDLFALGVFYGHSWPIKRYLNIEALIGVAVGYTQFNRYECVHCGQKLGREKKLFGMPEAAINIVYNIPGRPAKILPPEEPVVVVPTTPIREPEPFVPVLRAVPENTGRAGELQKSNPVLHHISEYRPYDRTRIMRREKDALYVYFPVSISILYPEFRENEPVLKRIVDVASQVMADTTSSVKVIQIVGLASIEGTIAGNERLAEDRALALQHYMQDKLQIPDSLFETVGGGEAWADFSDQLQEVVAKESQQTIAKELQQALDIIDSESDLDVREQKLRRMNGGRTWQYIKEQILKDQRNSGYIRIYYDYVPDENAKVINKASELLSTDCDDCHREALQLLLTVRNDERAQNALGTAYWLCDHQQEALQCFRRAAANGNADAKENLRQLEQAIQRENSSNKTNNH